MKISIITAVYNREDYIKDCIMSVKNQSYDSYEHIIIDGYSKDKTFDLIMINSHEKMMAFSEIDSGVYSAVNKGISKSSGEIIGILHSDDIYYSNSVIEKIAKIFNDNSVDVVYGDLEYVSKKNINNVVRYWKSGLIKRQKFLTGWMPPHPTMFIRKSLFEKYGLYNENYKISGDYDLILRFLFGKNLKCIYIPEVLIKMRIGGMSNNSISRILIKTSEDYRALKSNKVGGLTTVLLKNIRKISQFYQRS
jgi:glycosyltransferase